MNASHAHAALEAAIERLRPSAEAIFARQPLIDPECPETSDLDLLVFSEVGDLLTERLRVPTSGGAGQTMLLDLLWVPVTALDTPDRFARQGLMPHRLLQARPVFDATGRITAQARTVRELAHQPAVQRERLASILNFGSDVVREIGVTWDFPALARFWLQMARSACLAVLVDGLGGLCPNVYTRPLAYLRALDRERGTDMAAEFVAALGLQDHLDHLVAALRRIDDVVSARFPDANLPASMRPATRAEYRYFVATEELTWRIAVAREMAGRETSPSAVAYLRFWAYVLARIPMVYHLAMDERRSVSFLRPEREVRPALSAQCPEILEDLTRILAGPRGLTVGEVGHGLDRLLSIHEHAVRALREIGLEPSGVRAWQPFRPAPDSGAGSP